MQVASHIEQALYDSSYMDYPEKKMEASRSWIDGSFRPGGMTTNRQDFPWGLMRVF